MPRARPVGASRADCDPGAGHLRRSHDEDDACSRCRGQEFRSITVALRDHDGVAERAAVVFACRPVR